MVLKKILSLFSVTLLLFTATAQQKMTNYEKVWKKIDSLVQQRGLTESALTEVDKLYALAKKEKNNAQLIKALIYRMNLQSVKEENAAEKGIRQLEKEITEAPEPARSILQSIAASAYWNYFQQQRWRLYNRTTTVNFNKEDVATWNARDFHEKIAELFLASLKNEQLLQQTKLEPFDPIIIKGNVRYLRPTLFDLLGHRALEYFTNNERDLQKPAYAFEMDDPALYSDAQQFAAHVFTTKDTISLYFKALQLYQRLLKFHEKDPKPDALIDADIARISFVNEHAVMPEKDSLYKQALEKITSRHGQLPIAAQAWYLLANWYSTKAASYDPLKDTTHRYAYLDAEKICQQVIAQPTNSEGKMNCQNLLREIQRRTIETRTEKVNVPGQPFRALVKYRNFTELYVRVVKMDKATREKMENRNWEVEYWKQLLQLPVIKTFSQTLPATKDHQDHSVEIKVEGLPVGSYALISGLNKEFSLDNNPLSVQHFHVSNISWINKGEDYFALHRETGQPMAKASVQLWYRQYDYTNNKYNGRKGENIITDQNGYFHVIPAKKQNSDNYYQLEITTPDDHLFLDDYVYNYNYIQPETGIQQQNDRKSFLFTDRSIYRPGQMVYCKGIVVLKDKVTKANSILPKFGTTLVLYDVNGQKVDSMEVTTNEYGSYNARFTLPSNLLNGTFRIEDVQTESQHYITVEEYKRPKFYTEIAKPSGTYRLNDEIKVTGTAKGYAGNNIDGAAVKYRVVRKVIYPLWYYGFGSRYNKMIWPPRGQEGMEIAHGETTTDAKGEFQVSFKAIPDRSVDKKSQPTFYYEVSADVTDLNGETRSGTTTVAVAYQALRLNITLPEKLPADSLQQIKVASTNLNDLFEKATVTLTMHQLKAPDQQFRDRYWQQPDQFVLTEAEYKRLFPYDIYKNENEVQQWPRVQQVLEKTDTTSAAATFAIGKAKLPAGWYAIEAITKDKYGETVKDIRYVQLYENNTIIDPGSYISILPGKTKLEPGEQIKYQVSTNEDNAFVIHEVNKKDDKKERSYFTLNKNSKGFELPITEADRGGLGVSATFVKHNRIYSESQIFEVPYTNKDLTIAYATYRDKTLPGSEEKWKVTISGYKGDKVAAEMLTAMYDASLDQFKPQGWQIPSILEKFTGVGEWNGRFNFIDVESTERYIDKENGQSFEKTYDQLAVGESRQVQYMLRGRAGAVGNVKRKAVMEQAAAAPMDAALAAPMAAKGEAMAEAVDSAVGFGNGTEPPAPPQAEAAQGPAMRKNFNETAFFFPDLKTDAEGNIEFSFTMPEALTQWKWMSLAHTKELAFGYAEKTIITQKELMVQPNAPRFLREGDRMDFSAKIVNMTDKELSGQAALQLIDPTTNQPVDGWFRNMMPNQYFTVAAGQSSALNFTIEIPYQYNRPVTYRVIAKTGSLSDGEEAILPVVSNRMLVTESLPLPVRGSATKNFTFTKLLQSSNSETLNQHALTVEFTSNPAWYAVQALPYLMEYPYDCAEQVFNRYYANTLASSIANTAPGIQRIFEKWKTVDTAALLSNMQKNEELKSVLLQETPWVLEAQNEAQQKKNIAQLFDLVRMSKERQSAINKLHELQSPNGGFVWFKGGPDDRYITQYILTGIGHLMKLNALPKNDQQLTAIIKAAIPYLDKKLLEDYNYLVKNKVDLTKNNLGSTQIQYLYMRSFFPEYAVPGTIFNAYNYYRKQSQQFWLQQGKYMQGMIALALHRTSDLQTAKNIVASLKQNAIVNEELGMYWKDITSGYYWHQAPIESHALLIETFAEVLNDKAVIGDLKTWLLKQKQTQNWRTTKATADACYALLLQGSDWLTQAPEVQIKLGDRTIRSSDQQQEAGTGYFKEVIESKSVKPSMGNIQVTVKAKDASMPSWGAVYWQYFENLDKITFAATPLQLKKQLFVERNTDRGPVLDPLREGASLKVGDKVKVRIELRVDRDMEYVHMKDMRASCMEPVNVLSSYKWQGGLGYYESTKDASTNFFFDRLRKGTWVFEYPMFVTHTGTFSNGITTIQCMYAPEFTSHSEGVKVNVEGK